MYYPETLYDCYSYAVDNGFYFYCIYSDCNEAYFFDTSDDSVTKVLDDVENLFCIYKNGIVYSKGDAVFYRGNDDLYCIETMDNGDKKLFEIKRSGKHWNWYAQCDGEYLSVSMPYKKYIHNSWNNDIGVIMLYDDNEGLKPLGITDSWPGGVININIEDNGLYMIGIMIFDLEKGLFFKLPYHTYEKPEEGSYSMQLNYSGGKIYYMIQRVNFMGTPYDGETEFYRLTRK